MLPFHVLVDFEIAVQEAKGGLEFAVMQRTSTSGYLHCCLPTSFAPVFKERRKFAQWGFAMDCIEKNSIWKVNSK